MNCRVTVVVLERSDMIGRVAKEVARLLGSVLLQAFLYGINADLHYAHKMEGRRSISTRCNAIPGFFDFSICRRELRRDATSEGLNAFGTATSRRFRTNRF